MFYFSGKPESAFRPDILFPNNLKVWCRADMGVTSVAGAASSVTNYGSLGGTFAEATGSRQPQLSTARGQQSLLFDGGDGLSSSLAASNFKFLHDGSGSTLWVVARYNDPALGFGALIDTCSSPVRGYPASTGVCLYAFSGGANMYYEAGRANATPTNALAGRTVQYIANQVSIVRSKTAGSPNACSFFNNGRMFLAAYGGAAAAGNPDYTMRVGSLASNNANGWVGHVLEWGALDIYATDAQHEQLETYIAERYGMTFGSGA